MTQPELFEAPAVEPLADGACVLRGYAVADAAALLDALQREVLAQAPWRHMTVPGGRTMSVAMTNCGALGWVSSAAGYRYAPQDPQTGRPWPAMPRVFSELAAHAAAAAGYAGFVPDACLVNRYAAGARLSLHQDRDEPDRSAPIVSVSLLAPATFLWGGLTRRQTPRRVRLCHGDVVVWGGPSRLVYHGVAPLADTDGDRINLTFRKAGS